MPYCVQCGYEYVPGVRTCPDCSSVLQPELPAVCGACGEAVAADETCCSSCGVFLETEGGGAGRPFCATHPDAEAVGCCVVCRRALCGECVRTLNGRMLCSDHQHLKTAFHWVVACTASTEYEAEMIRANLESGGIPAFVLPQRDRMYVSTVSDLSVTEVMVPPESLEDARAYIRSLETTEPPATDQP